MSNAIEHAARALWDYDNDDQTPEWREMAWNDMGGSEPCQERIEYICRARWLASEGLLAPAPLREEWGTRFGGYVVEGRADAEYPFFWKGVPPPGVNVHRYRTDWLPADGISRAEGDGRAESHE